MDILSEAVFANSKTLDSRRFAEEFIRRRKLADKGVVPEAGASTNFSTASSDSKGNGGWSEVAKKPVASATKEESNSQFKVVAARKKNKK